MKFKRTVSSLIALAMVMSGFNVSFAEDIQKDVLSEESLIKENFIDDITTDTVISDSALEVQENTDEEEATPDAKETETAIDDTADISDDEVIDLNASYIVTYAVGGGDIYFNTNTNTVVSADKTVTSANIPIYINGTRVRYIGESAFLDCTSLSYVTIPDGAWRIENDAFEGCTNLTYIDIPDSITNMGGAVFRNCSSLESIVLPELAGISYSMFENCNKLKDIDLPYTTTNIGERAFYGCKNLDYIYIPSKVIKIWDSAFCGCSSLTSINLSHLSNVTLNPCAFKDCTSLRTVTMPNWLYDGISYSLFENCTSLESIDIPYGADFIGDSAFKGCTSLNSITIPSSVTRLFDQCFTGCESLESISLPDSIIRMGIDDFSCCTNLKSVNMPKAMVDGLDGTFVECNNLESIVVPEGVTFLDSTFINCHKLSNVVLPESLKKIGADSFCNCSALTNIILPNSLEKICSYAFDGTPLNSITIPKNVSSIEEYCFISSVYYIDDGSDGYRYIDTLKEIKVDENNMYYSDEDGVLFNKNKTELVIFPPGKNIQDYIIPSSVEIIDEGTFVGNRWVKSITIPAKTTIIGNYNFSSCNSLTDINVDTNNMIYYSEQGVLFNKNKTELIAAPGGLTEYNIPSKVISVGNNAFYHCANLKNITIPNSVTSIGEFAFDSCKNLKEINIPTSVTSVGAFAFYNCNSIKNAIIPNGIKTIDCIFNTCSELLSITIPSSVTSISEFSFAGCNKDNLIFYVEKDSYADTWAKEHGWKVSYDIPVYQKGDVNNDGVIDSKDSLRLLKHIAGHNVEIDSIAADVNGDGIVDSKDSLRLLKYIAGYDVVLQ